MEVKRLAIKTSVIAFTRMSSDILSSLKDAVYTYKCQAHKDFSRGEEKKPSSQYNRYFSCRFSNLILSAQSTFIFIPKLKKNNLELQSTNILLKKINEMKTILPF